MSELVGVCSITILTKLSPEGIEHEFRGSFSTGIFGNHGWIQIYSLALLILANVAGFLSFRLAPRWVPAAFVLDFEPGVDIGSKETATSFFEMPYLVDFDETIPLCDGFMYFWSTQVPRSILPSCEWIQM